MLPETCWMPVFQAGGVVGDPGGGTVAEYDGAAGSGAPTWPGHGCAGTGEYGGGAVDV